MRNLGHSVVLVAAIAITVAPRASAQEPSLHSVLVKPAAHGVSVNRLVSYAFGVRDFQIVGGPDWAGRDLWSC